MRKLPPIPPFHERFPLLVIMLAYVSLMTAAMWSRANWFASILPGKEPYYQAKISELVLTRVFASSESLLGFARPLFLTPFHVISANISYFTGIYAAARWMPLVCGALILISLWYLCGKLGFDNRKRFFLVLLFSLSPVFVRLSLTFTEEAISVLAIVLGLALVLDENLLLRGLGGLMLTIAALQGPVEVMLIGISLLALSRVRRKDMAFFVFIGIMAATFFALRMSIFISTYGYPIWPPLFLDNFLIRSFSILDGNWGFGFFGLALGIGGVFASWKLRAKIWPSYVVLLALTIFSVYGLERANVFSSIILSAYGALMIESLIKREWSLHFIKEATLWLLISGAMFSGLVEVTSIVRAGPVPDDIIGLTELSKLCSPRDVVLSDPSRGYWIESIAGCTPLLDYNTLYVKDAETRLNDTYRLFYSKDLKRTQDLLDKYEIRYIYVDREMKEGLVWDEPDEGLLFMFRNNETFKRAFIHPSIEIWEVTPRSSR